MVCNVLQHNVGGAFWRAKAPSVVRIINAPYLDHLPRPVQAGMDGLAQLVLDDARAYAQILFIVMTCFDAYYL